MGLRDEIQSELIEAFNDELEDVITEFNLYKMAISTNPSDYNVTTGKTAIVDTSPNVSRGIFSAYPADKIDGVDIRTTDEKLIIIASEIDVSIEIGDKIVTLLNSIDYRVVNPNAVMGGNSIPIIYNAQVRKNAK